MLSQQNPRSQSQENEWHSVGSLQITPPKSAPFRYHFVDIITQPFEPIHH